MRMILDEGVTRTARPRATQGVVCLVGSLGLPRLSRDQSVRFDLLQLANNYNTILGDYNVALMIIPIFDVL